MPPVPGTGPLIGWHPAPQEKFRYRLDGLIARALPRVWLRPFCHRLFALAILGLQACGQQEPEHVYVPADDYVISVQIALPAEARAGEWTPLSAQRRSGPWMQPHRRFVLFPKPGSYQAWARSAYPTDAKSDIVTVNVR